MTGIEGILKKLNIMEQFTLKTYIQKTIATENLKITGSVRTELERATKEREDNIVKLNNDTWDTINDNLMIAMREYHVSPERIDLINMRLMKLLNDEKETLMIGDMVTEGSYNVFSKDDCSSLCEVLFESKCKGCRTNHFDCSFYPILHKHNVPDMGMDFKCKYAF